MGWASTSLAGQWAPHTSWAGERALSHLHCLLVRDDSLEQRVLIRCGYAHDRLRLPSCQVGTRPLGSTSSTTQMVPASDRFSPSFTISIFLENHGESPQEELSGVHLCPPENTVPCPVWRYTEARGPKYAGINRE